MAGHHLSLSVSRELWNEILRSALPFHIANGEFTLAGAARTALTQLQLKDRVAGLLEGPKSERLERFTGKAREVWHARRGQVFQSLNDLIRVEGTWTFDVDDLGTDLKYGTQKVAADAFVRGVAEGQIHFLRENVTIPFRIEKRLGASVALGRIRYSKDKDAVIGNVQDLAVHLGDNVVLQLLGRLVEYGVSQRLDSIEPVSMLKREQVEGLFGPLGGPLRMQLGVDDLQLDIDGEDMTLKVRFGFSRLGDTPQLASGEF